MVEVALNDREMNYLVESSVLPESILKEFILSKVHTKFGHTFHLSDEKAEECRSIFTRRLAAVGFDSKYNTNQEGENLERLIDKFSGLR